jgi:hypothetical protein
MIFGIRNRKNFIGYIFEDLELSFLLNDGTYFYQEIMRK